MNDFTLNPDGPIEEVKIDDSKAYIKLKGEIDLNSSPEVRTVIQEILDNKRTPLVIIDLHNVPYMDSSGVATLVEVFQKVNRYNGKLILTGLQERVKSVFEIAKLTEIFDIRENISE